MGVIFPAEGHVRIGDVNQPMVGDGDTVRVPSQIVQDVVWAAEWSFSIYDPFLPKERAKEGMERILIRQGKACAVECELLPLKSALETGHKLPAENLAQNSHREKEPRGRPDPPLPAQRQTAARHDTVNVRVPLQGLPPSVKNTQEADLGPEVLGIGCYFEQRLRAGLEKEPEQNLLVLPDQWDQRMRDAEDQVVVVHGQQFALPRCQPLLTGVGLAFWTV